MGSLDLSALRLEGLIEREWLATSGNGGYASSTLCGLNTRKYHGLLVAAMAPPVRRMVLLSRVEETVHFHGKSFDLAANDYPGVVHPKGYAYLRAFNHEPFPRWGYQAGGWTLEKQLQVLKGQNTVVLSYTLLGGSETVELELRPLFALRPFHELMYQWNARLDGEELTKRHHRIPATARSPEVFFAHDGAFAPQPCWYLNTIYRREQERGYAGLEDLWMPGAVRWTLAPGQSVHFICSAEPINFTRVLADIERQSEAGVAPIASPRPDAVLDGLTRAAGQFVVQTRERTPAIIGDYPWSAPLGRDAMICLPGLLLTTGRMDEARALLTEFAQAMKDGLMPSEMAEDGSGYRYTAVDTSLWFIHAVGQYLRYRGDEGFVRRDLMPVIHEIIEKYRVGTGLGIRTDADGLLVTHAPGLAVTWMDAQLGDWMVTPRHGRPVEVNALWYNAIGTAADLSGRFGQREHADELQTVADRLKAAFNRRFWNAAEGCCFDVVADHGNDGSVRPNQLLAISLPHAVLDLRWHEEVLAKVATELLTPFGLRTLSPRDRNYRGQYAGPATQRDPAYHQGSAFPWLLGAMVGAHLRVHGRGETARASALAMLEGCFEYLHDQGVGQICELFDGDAPHRPGGAVASARSVAELLRCYVEDVLDMAPGTRELRPRPVVQVPGLPQPPQEVRRGG